MAPWIRTALLPGELQCDKFFPFIVNLLFAEENPDVFCNKKLFSF